MGTNVWKYGKKNKNRQFPFESKGFPRLLGMLSYIGQKKLRKTKEVAKK